MSRAAARTGVGAPGGAGFSTFEMLGVLAIVALALALIVPALRGPGPHALLAGQARGLGALLVEARANALLSGRLVICEIDVDQRTVRVQPGGRRLQLPATLALSATVEDAGLAAGRRAHLHFFPDGSASGGRIVLGAGALATAVVVDRMTGDVAVSRVGER